MMAGSNGLVDETISRIPKNTVGVEIGVWRGETSLKILMNTIPKHLHLVDPWSLEPYRISNEFNSFEKFLDKYYLIVGTKKEEDFVNYYEKVYRNVCKQLQPYPVTVHRVTSDIFFQTFQEPVDWIYIDGDHTYEGVAKDLENSYKLIKPGGFIFGDDYNYFNIKDRKQGVTDAVNDFIKKYRLPFVHYNINQYQIGILK